MAERHVATARRQQEAVLRAAVDDGPAQALLGHVHSELPGLDGLAAEDFVAAVVEASPLPPFDRHMRHRIGGPSSAGRDERLGAVRDGAAATAR